MLSRSNLAVKSDCFSLGLLHVAIGSFSNNLHICTTANKNDLMLKRSPIAKPTITISKLFPSVYFFSTECDEGNFGYNCSSPCHCLDDTPCNHINGSCPGNLCAPGWKSDNCSIGSFTTFGEFVFNLHSIH